VQCGGKRGDSVMLEMTGSNKYLQIHEIQLYQSGKIDFKLYRYVHVKKV